MLPRTTIQETSGCVMDAMATGATRRRAHSAHCVFCDVFFWKFWGSRCLTFESTITPTSAILFHRIVLWIVFAVAGSLAVGLEGVMGVNYGLCRLLGSRVFTVTPRVRTWC
jgi:hypothetical protein